MPPNPIAAQPQFKFIVYSDGCGIVIDYRMEVLGCSIILAYTIAGVGYVFA